MTGGGVDLVFTAEFDAKWQRAIMLFNDQEFYTCHDVLEDIWNDAPMHDRDFYKGILQIAVGFYHLQRGNLRGAMALIGSGIANLRNFQPDYCGIDTVGLVTASYEIWRNLQVNRLPDALPQLCPC
jgi:predicted metal-dependent hydrolase